MDEGHAGLEVDGGRRQELGPATKEERLLCVRSVGGGDGVGACVRRSVLSFVRSPRNRGLGLPQHLQVGHSLNRWSRSSCTTG